MGWTPARALNRSASSESLAVPDGQPWMDRRDRMICSGLIDSGSGATPTTTSLPPGASPSIRAEMALASGAVASAEERGGVGGGQIPGNGGHGFGGGDHVFGIAPVKAEGGDLFELTENEIPTAAGIARKAMSAVPAHPGPLAGLPVNDIRPDRIDASGDLVARNTRILQARPETILDQHIAVA